MVEQITTNQIRCDACSQIINGSASRARIFTKDLCANCACGIIDEIGKRAILDVEEFLEIMDDYKYSWACKQQGDDLGK